MKIHVLDSSVANLIAAGEVVERPASVVKELVENSVDAGADKISVEILKGGIDLIKVTDNGCGMTEEDARVAFRKHATSKITTKEDLYNIGTLGFRGEALAAISAVSRVELITKTKDSVGGVRLSLEAGELCGDIVSSEEVGCADGSVFCIRDLFYNVPARKKFLKSEQAEAGAISSVVHKLALSHPEISFRLTVGGKETLFTSGNGKLEDTIFSVYGKSVTQNLVPVRMKNDDFRLSGFIGTPLFSKPNRNMQLFYVNGRIVRSRLLQTCLENAYRNSMLIGRYPVCVLFLQVDNSSIDINVHPSKLEIKFGDEKSVSVFMNDALRTALSFDNAVKHIDVTPATNDVFRLPFENSAPQKTPEPPKKTVEKVKNYGEWQVITKVPVSENSIPEQKPEVLPKNETEVKKSSSMEETSEFEKLKKMLLERAVAAEKPAETLRDDSSLLAPDLGFSAKREPEPEKYAPSVTAPVPDISEPPKKETVNAPVPTSKDNADEPTLVEKTVEFRIVGEVFDSFIIVEKDGDVLFIDKHALHERMNFEKLKRGTVGSQYLLSPIVVELGAAENLIITENAEELKKAGFEVEDFGGSVIVRMIPQILENSDVEYVLAKFADNYENLKLGKNDLLDEFLHDCACKASIKAGMHTSAFETEKLIRNYFEHENDLKYCPHGRPITFALSKTTIEKQFKRIV